MGGLPWGGPLHALGRGRRPGGGRPWGRVGKQAGRGGPGSSPVDDGSAAPSVMTRSVTVRVLHGHERVFNSQ